MQYRFEKTYCMKSLHIRNSMKLHNIVSKKRIMQSFYIFDFAKQKLDQEKQIMLKIFDFFAY